MARSRNLSRRKEPLPLPVPAHKPWRVGRRCRAGRMTCGCGAPPAHDPNDPAHQLPTPQRAENLPLSDKAARCHAASVQGGHNGRPARSLRPRHRFFSNLRMPGSFSVLSFLSGKEKKEPKKRNLNGEGDACKPSGGPTPSYVSCFSRRGFSFRKAPQNIFAGKVSSADGRAQRADPSGFMAFALVLFSPPERKENGKKIKIKIKKGPPYGRGERAARRWSMASR